MRPRPPVLAALGAAAVGAAVLAACVPHQTRRPGSDLVVVRRTFDPVAAVVRTQCRPGPTTPAVRDSLTGRALCPVVVGDSTARDPGEPLLPPQRVP